MDVIGLVLAGSTPAWTFPMAVVSAVMASCSLLLGLSTRSTARRALGVSEAQEARRDPKLHLELLDGVAWRTRGVRNFALKVLATNPTDRDGTLTRVELRLTYKGRDDHVLTVQIPATIALPDCPPEFVALPVPTAMPANGAVAGSYLFRVDDEVTSGRPVERFELHVTDSRGIVKSVVTAALREVDNGERP
ncbi:hypothetical protein KSP35_19860 [Aquihabitans sp. G128]|uniref:hypothetical protein n=1 Tax=Aquihabitans sp. G128 TaxID=2849779 RepID=UPI001C22F153|nr:hypothetical protein [Aquihabitans sp. G128]QXC60552.1 hypothetical protein KSP35_19860 [Aquihabitans sp. G128]